MSVTVKRLRIKVNDNGEIVNIVNLVNCLETCNLLRVANNYYCGAFGRLIDTMLDYKLSKILSQLPEGLRSRVYDEAYEQYRSEKRHVCDPRRISYYMAKFITENCIDAELLKRT